MEEEHRRKRRSRQCEGSSMRLDPSGFAAELQRLGGRLADLRPEAADIIRATIDRLSTATAIASTSNAPLNQPLKPPSRTPSPPSPLTLPSQDLWVPRLPPSTPVPSLVLTTDGSNDLDISFCQALKPSRTLIVPDAAAVPTTLPLMPLVLARPIVMALSVTSRIPLTMQTSVPPESTLCEKLPVTDSTPSTTNQTVPSPVSQSTSTSKQTVPSPLSQSTSASKQTVPLPVSQSKSHEAFKTTPKTVSIGENRTPARSLGFLALLLDQLTSSGARDCDSSSSSSSSSSRSSSRSSSSSSSRGKKTAEAVDRCSATMSGFELEEVQACDLSDEYDEIRVVVRQG